MPEDHHVAMSGGKKLFLGMLCLIIVGVSVGLGKLVVDSGPKPKRKKPEFIPPSVKVDRVQLKSQALKLELQGTVEASRWMRLKGEVAGKIVKLSPNFEVGKVVKKGEVLVELEKLDYLTQLAQRKADLAKANMDLEIELGQKSLAEREWDLIDLKDQASEQEKKLALRVHQLDMAKARVTSAKAALELAKKNVERTQIKAPFDAYVTEKMVDLGSRISAQENLARLIALSPYWVRVSMPYEKIKYLQTRTAEKKGSLAKVEHLTQKVTYEGEVLRVLPELEKNTRMAQVLIEMSPDQNDGLLLIDAYVRVQIQAQNFENAVVLPRSYLKDGHLLHLVQNDQLKIKSVDYLSHGRHEILVLKGLESGDKIVNSSLSAPVDGMKVSVIEE